MQEKQRPSFEQDTLWSNGFLMIPRTVFSDKSLSLEDKAVLCFLIDCANNPAFKILSFGYKYICEQVAISKNKYIHAIKKLEMAGYVKNHRRGKGQTNVIEILINLQKPSEQIAVNSQIRNSLPKRKYNKKRVNSQNGNSRIPDSGIAEFPNQEFPKWDTSNTTTTASKNNFSNTLRTTPVLQQEKEFLDDFNEITNRKYRVLDGKTKQQLKQILKVGYCRDDIRRVLKIASEHQWLRGSNDRGKDFLTPEYITRIGKFEDYFSQSSPPPPTQKKDWKDFLSFLKDVTGKDWRGTETAFNQLESLREKGFSDEEISKAICKMWADEKFRKFFSPEIITKQDTLERYLNLK